MKSRTQILLAVGLGISVAMNLTLVGLWFSQKSMIGFPVPPPGTVGFAQVAQERIGTVMARIVQEPERRERIMVQVREGLQKLEKEAQAMRGAREQSLDVLIRNPQLPIPPLAQIPHLRIDQTITSVIQSVTLLMTPEEREHLLKEIRQAGRPGRH